MDKASFIMRTSSFVNRYDQLEAEGVSRMQTLIDDDMGIERFSELLTTLAEMKDAALQTENRTLAEACLFMTVGIGACLNKVLLNEIQEMQGEGGANAE